MLNLTILAKTLKSTGQLLKSIWIMLLNINAPEGPEC